MNAQKPTKDNHSFVAYWFIMLALIFSCFAGWCIGSIMGWN